MANNETGYVPRYLNEMAVTVAVSPGSSTAETQDEPDYGYSFRTPDEKHFVAGSINVYQQKVVIRHRSEASNGDLSYIEHLLPEDCPVSYGMSLKDVRNALVRAFGYSVSQ